MQLVTKSFERQALAFPEKVDQALAQIETIEQAKDLLDKASAMAAYAARLKHGMEVAKPISFGVLKIKAKLGEMMPAEKGGRNKPSSASEGFSHQQRHNYRKIASNAERLQEYMDDCDDVPSQSEFLRWCDGVHVAKNSGNNEWYTPSEYIEAARAVLGGIDLDPASSEQAQSTVGALSYFTIDDDGLSQEWSGRVWMNPPYSSDLVQQFIYKLVAHYVGKEVSAAVVLVNNATETEWFQHIADHASVVCFPKGRIKYLDETGEPAKTPLQGQAILYLGGAVKRFAHTFSKIGIVKGTI